MVTLTGLSPKNSTNIGPGDFGESARGEKRTTGWKSKEKAPLRSRMRGWADESENHALVPSQCERLPTEVNTKDGIVTLKVQPPARHKKDLTTEYAKDVEGVKDVKNEMTVTKTRQRRVNGVKIVKNRMAIIVRVQDQRKGRRLIKQKESEHEGGANEKRFFLLLSMGKQ